MNAMLLRRVDVFILLASRPPVTAVCHRRVSHRYRRFSSVRPTTVTAVCHRCGPVTVTAVVIGVSAPLQPFSSASRPPLLPFLSVQQCPRALPGKLALACWDRFHAACQLMPCGLSRYEGQAVTFADSGKSPVPSLASFAHGNQSHSDRRSSIQPPPKTRSPS